MSQTSGVPRHRERSVGFNYKDVANNDLLHYVKCASSLPTKLPDHAARLEYLSCGCEGTR